MSDDAATVGSLLERFRDAWARLDADAALACFDHEPGAIVIGTDHGEFWRSYEEVLEPFRAMTAAFDRAEYRYSDGDPVIEVVGEMAWAAGILYGSFDTARRRVELPMRMTAVMRRNPDSSWVIRHAHFSVAAADPVEY